MMRSVTVSQSDVELDSDTESLLFNALQNLDRVCDSLLRCRVEITGGRGSAGPEPWRVKLLLNTAEHDVFTEGMDDASASTPRNAILDAIRGASAALINLKLANKCTACCDQLVSAPSALPAN